MEKAGDEPITDWILPAEAWRLLVERWGDRNVCEELARKGLAEGGPWCCRRVDGGAKKNPDLFRSKPLQIFWKEGWAQVMGPEPTDWGPRHWFSLSRAWVLALGQQEMEGPAAKTLGDWVSRTASQHPRGKAENPTAYANRLYGLLSADPKARSQFPNTDWQSIRTRLYELELVPRRRH